MKLRQTIPILFAFVSTAGLAQKKDEINLSDPYQIDSSEYFIIPRLVDNDNKEEYGKGKAIYPGEIIAKCFFTTAPQGKLKNSLTAGLR